MTPTNEQQDLELPSTRNAILVDALELERLLTGLYSSYNPDLLSDLCGLLVQVILRDRIYLVPSSRLVFTETAFLRPWLDQGAAFYLRRRRSGKLAASGESTIRRPIYANGAPLIGAALATELPVFATGPRREAFEAFAPRSVEHTICDLLGQYMKLEERAIQTLLKHRLVHPLYWQFRVPPLPLEVLRRCKSVHDIPGATVDVRQEHANLRRQFAEMNGLISDPSIEPRRKLGEIRKLSLSLAAVQRAADGQALVTFSNSGGYILKGAAGAAQATHGALTGDGFKGLKGGAEFLKNAATVAKKAFGQRVRAWRLEPIHRSISGYMQTSDQAMFEHVTRLFGPPS